MSQAPQAAARPMMMRSAGLRLLAVVALGAVLAACADPTPPVPGLGSETTGPPSAADGQNGDGVDGDGVDGDGTDGAGGGDGSVDEGTDGDTDSGPADRPVDLVPTDRFQRLPAEQFGNASTEAIITAALPFGGAWLLAGGIEDGRSRTVRAAVWVLSPGRPDETFSMDLPAAGAPRSMASGLALEGETVLVPGFVADDGGSAPVLWLGETDSEEWELVRLPVDESVEEASAHLVAGANLDRSLLGDDLYVVGHARVDGFDRLLAWRDDGSGWQAMPIDATTDDSSTDDQDRDGDPARDRGRDVVAAGATVVAGRLLVVGSSIGATGQPEPRVWVEAGGRLVLGDDAGLPGGGSLHDVMVTPDGTLVAAGAETGNGISTPLVALADGPNGSWETRTTEVDLAGWVSFGGVEFGRLAADVDHLYTALTNPVVQQVFRSSDGGRSWERIGNLSLDGGNFVPVDTIALGGDGTILVAGSDVVMELSGAVWYRMEDAEAVPTQRGALQAVDVVAGQRGFTIGGGRSSRSGSQLHFETVLWQSPDGVTWGRPPVANGAGFIVTDLLSLDAGATSGLIAGGSYFTPSSVIRPDRSGRWSASLLPLGEAFLEHSLQGVDGAVVAAGSRPREDLSRTDPIFVVIESDDRVREIPLTNSPVPDDANGSVRCLAGAVGRMLAVLEWGDGETGVAVSSNGERWRGLEPDAGLQGWAISACHGNPDGFLLGGRDDRGRAVVARSTDGVGWRLETVEEASAILGIDELADGGGVHLSGWSTAADGFGRDGAIWRSVDTGWQRLIDTGLEGDGFSRFTEVTGLAVRDGIIVAVGTDRGRAGAWVATTEVLS